MIRDRFENTALVLALLVLALAGLFYLLTTPKTEPVQESRPYYVYHVIGGMEDDVGHIIEKSITTGGKTK